MTIWQTSLLDPIYASPIAVNATIVRTTGERHTIRAIDETEGVSLPGPGALVEMQTQRPAAVCRLGELNAKGITDLKEFFWQGKLTINGRTWRIKSFQPRPTQEGPGEIIMFLADPEP
jgi:hypothetical protein